MPGHRCARLLDTGSTPPTIWNGSTALSSTERWGSVWTGSAPVLDHSTTDAPEASRAHRALVAERIDRLQQLTDELDRMIEAHERGALLTTEQQTTIFGPGWDPDWPAQARQRYGDTTQWQQYAERSASRGPEEWQAIADAVADLDRTLADAMDAGVTLGSPEANQLVERHRDVFASYFPLTRQMQVCLGRMYETDPGFAAHYDGICTGLATWSVESSTPAHAPTASSTVQVHPRAMVHERALSDIQNRNSLPGCH